MRGVIFLLLSLLTTVTSRPNYISHRSTDVDAFISQFGDVVYGTPSVESGRRVSQWSPNDNVNPEELGMYVEGDMLIPSYGRNGVDKPHRWKDGIIPYKISDDFSYKTYNMIMAAIEDFHTATCVKWVRWSGEKDYVYFTSKNSGCWSVVGRFGGMQELNLQSPGCLTQKGTVLHEMIHAAGFVHEQNRKERDDHVTINWKNILKGKESNFYKSENSEGFGVPYDYRSIMHYSAKAFSANNQPTIEPRKKGVELGQREAMSNGDMKKLRLMYCKNVSASPQDSQVSAETKPQTGENTGTDSVDSAASTFFSLFTP